MNAKDYAEPSLWPLDTWSVALGIVVALAFALSSGVPKFLREEASMLEAVAVSVLTIFARTAFWFAVWYLVSGIVSGELQRNIRLIFLQL